MRNQSTNSDWQRMHCGPIPAFLKWGEKASLLERTEPREESLPFPKRVNIDGSPGDLCLFQAYKPKLVLHPPTNFQEQNNTFVP